MSKVKSLFQKAWTAVVNPGQDERVNAIVNAIAQAFQTKKSAFNLDEVIRPIECTHTDVKVAVRAYYDRLLKQFWEKGIPDENHRKLLAFVAGKLGIPADETAKANEAIASVFFAASLAEVLQDGMVTDDERIRLNNISAFVGMSVQEFVRRNALNEGISLLRGLFAEAASTGRLDPLSWQNLLHSCSTLGIEQPELVRAVTPLARSFAEHVLADTKSDGLLTGQEEEYLKWLDMSFGFDNDFRTYLHQEVLLLKERTQIATGNLQALLPPSGLNLKAGEVTYFFGHSYLRLVKQLKSGPQAEDHQGLLVLTDSRLVFSSATKPVSIPYRAIIAWQGNGEQLNVSVPGKPPLSFSLPSEKLFAEKFDALIRMHSQVLRKKVDGAPDRHIPREIRQRVWQRYGGKCADCGASEYLEFDHIVPVAKGGSNSDQNVQLLCRKCNLKKSDRI